MDEELHTLGKKIKLGKFVIYQKIKKSIGYK
jgi:hypothetical protein